MHCRADFTSGVDQLLNTMQFLNITGNTHEIAEIHMRYLFFKNDISSQKSLPSG